MSKITPNATSNERDIRDLENRIEVLEERSIEIERGLLELRDILDAMIIELHSFDE